MRSEGVNSEIPEQRRTSILLLLLLMVMLRMIMVIMILLPHDTRVIRAVVLSSETKVFYL